MFSDCLHKRNRSKPVTREQNYSLWCQERREECESVLCKLQKYTWKKTHERTSERRASVSLLEIRWHLCTADTRHCEVRAAARAVKNTFHLQFCPPTHNSQKHTHMYWQTLPNDIRVGTADLCFWTRVLKSLLISITCLHYSSNLLWHSQLRPLYAVMQTHTHTHTEQSRGMYRRCSTISALSGNKSQQGVNGSEVMLLFQAFSPKWLKKYLLITPVHTENESKSSLMCFWWMASMYIAFFCTSAISKTLYNVIYSHTEDGGCHASTNLPIRSTLPHNQRSEDGTTDPSGRQLQPSSNAALYANPYWQERLMKNWSKLMKRILSFHLFSDAKGK